MKKIILCLSALLSLSLTAVAQTITVADMEALPGETVTASLSLTAPVDIYTGIQFAMQFPEDGFSIATTGAVSGWNGSLEYGAMNAGKVKFAAAASRTFGTVTIAVEFTVEETVTLGSYDITVTDIVFEGAGEKKAIDDVTFKVKVVAAHTVVLDENSTTAPSEATGVNVRVLRTITAGNWSTICLPFAMTEAKTKAAFGDDVQIADFTGCEATYDEATGEDIIALKVNFDNVTAMEANHPYIIKLGNDITEFSVEDVDIVPSDELSVDRDEDRYKRNGKWYYDYNSFIGTYEAGTEIPESALFLSGNKFWYSVGKTTTKAFRGYFAFYMVLSAVSAAEARISMWFGDGETTGVKTIDDLRFVVSGCYDLQGRSVELPTKGFYVKDGRKVIIK